MMKKHIVLIVIVLSSLMVEAQVCINEIMPKNVSVLRDAATEYSMWVEVYNPRNVDVNLSGFFFSDNLEEPRKWNPGSVSIKAKGYCLLFFERENTPGHATFKLDPEGGNLYLFNRTGGLVDRVSYPAQYRNVSYGRSIDGGGEWVFFEESSPAASNNEKAYAMDRCQEPVFRAPGGFYSSAQPLSFVSPFGDETIYYTTDGSEPTTSSTRYVSPVKMTKTTVVRAKMFSPGQLSSDVVSRTYFIAERAFDLPVISIITDNINLNDNTYGIYVNGTNGIGNYCDAAPRNYNRNWDRPANFEWYDVQGKECLNQELDICISGGCTRYIGLKSLKIQPKTKFGNSRLDYDFFKSVKPNQKYKDIVLRNSSNDFSCSMMRDGFIQTLVGNPMGLEYQAYQPTVIFINGVYYGLINARERHNADMLYSKYGLSEDDVVIEEASYDSFPQGKDYQDFYYFFANQNDMNREGLFDEISAIMDVDDYINYNIAEIYAGNTDWSHNNYIMWKRRNGGKWRWILNDVEFGYGLSSSAGDNTLGYAMGEGNSWSAWSVLVFKQLMSNDIFRERFIDNMCVHISSTFDVERTNRLLDSLSAQIATEIEYHKAKWGSSMTLASDVARMKTFAANRPAYVMNQLSSRYLNNVSYSVLNLTSNLPKASYYVNDAYIKNASIQLKYFQNRPMNIRANEVDGYVFKHWECPMASGEVSWFDKKSSWKYYAASTAPSGSWYALDYNDASWQSGNAQFGYGNKGEATNIGYGGNTSQKYTTSYYRKTMTLSNLSSKSNFEMSLLVDDGAIVYINGKELGRYNMPSGTVSYSTFSTTYSGSGDLYTVNIPVSMLKEGKNIVAAEVHQCDRTSSDVVFDMSISYATSQTIEVVTDKVFTSTIGRGFSLKAVYEKDTVTSNASSVRINEVVSSNQFIVDEYGETDDYIELYNAGNEAVNIAGWYVSDTPIYPMLSLIPSTDSSKTFIPAGGWLTLWADGTPEQGVLHLGCKVSADGESILLSRLEDRRLVLVDSVTVPSLEKNSSYARVPDGGNEWRIQEPTPSASNIISSLESLQQGRVKVYPTLVKTVLHIVQAENNMCRLIDLSGKCLYQTICSGEESIDMTSFREGIYLLQVGDEYIKIVKQSD